jgi:hypothetical protein
MSNTEVLLILLGALNVALVALNVRGLVKREQLFSDLCHERVQRQIEAEQHAASLRDVKLALLERVVDIRAEQYDTIVKLLECPPPANEKLKKLMKEVPCPVPWPACNPNECSNCGGKGSTLEEV